jgi:alpha-tubulin suppressor-like RCC1 family protein
MRTLLTRSVMLLAALALFVASAGPATASSQKFVQISTGEDHTCGLTSRGAAYCWGYNGYGELGDGTTTDSGVNGPQAVIGGLKFTSIQTGGYYTCGLTSRGAAYCWGYNEYGQLGDGTTTDSNNNGPQAVIGGLKFASISVGYYHACGLTSRGAAYCWGYNGGGELGDGTTTDSNNNGPQAVIGGLKFASISAGYYYTCGLTTRGTAYCWGDNYYGQLGDGTTTDSDENGPQAVIGGLKFASLSAESYYHTCGLTSRGAAYCWGYNFEGQLGDGTRDDSEEAGPQAVIGGLKFASIQTGGYHTCGLTSRGAAYCWGYNSSGQLGDGTTTNSNEAGPQAVIGGLRFARLGVDGYHACGLTTRGAAYCWGDNYYGELGDGTTDNSGVNGPVQVR